MKTRLPSRSLVPQVISAIAAATFSSFTAAAQNEVPMTYEERLQSVANLKEHITAREARFDILREDLQSLDARTERKIDSIVTTLRGMKDSTDSKTRIAKLKQDVIDGLVRTVWTYRQKRMELYERMRKDEAVPREELAKTMEMFDARINKRIDQVVDLAKSFAGHQDVEKYESYGSSYYDGWHYENTRISDEWRQNRRAATSGRVARRDVLKQIDDAIEYSESRRASIAETLANRQLGESERATHAEELGRLDAKIDHLRDRRREIALPGDGGIRELGNLEAHDAKLILADARADLARDFAEIIRKYSDLQTERIRIFSLKNNLAAREQWLEKNPPPATNN